MRLLCPPALFAWFIFVVVVVVVLVLFGLVFCFCFFQKTAFILLIVKINWYQKKFSQLKRRDPHPHPLPPIRTGGSSGRQLGYNVEKGALWLRARPCSRWARLRHLQSVTASGMKPNPYLFSPVWKGVREWYIGLNKGDMAIFYQRRWQNGNFKNEFSIPNTLS